MRMHRGLAILAIAVFGAGALALCPDKDKAGATTDATLVKSGCPHAKTVAQKGDGAVPPCCAKAKAQAKTVAAPASAKSGKKGCCAKAKAKAQVKTVAAPASAKSGKKGCCAKAKAKAQAKTVAAKGDGTKPCCAKAKAKTVAAAGTAKKKGCCAKSAAKIAGTEKLQAILASMPSMTFRVGDVKTGCSKQAAALVAEKHAKLTYLVGDEAFEDEAAALARLTSALDEKAAELLSMQFAVGDQCSRCPVTAKEMAKKAHKAMMYRVAGFDFTDRQAAASALKKAQDAAAKVAMAFKVGDKVYQCGKTAGATAKQADAKVTYVIGDQETPCSKRAAQLLAETKIKTIVETVASEVVSSS
ncbi:MAG: hypothetical protein ACE5E6_10570 [Phycisphaerae bacterium]